MSRKFIATYLVGFILNNIAHAQALNCTILSANPEKQVSCPNELISGCACISYVDIGGTPRNGPVNIAAKFCKVGTPFGSEPAKAVCPFSDASFILFHVQ